MKKRKNKTLRLVSLIVAGVILIALATTTIILAVKKVDYNVNLPSNPYEIIIYNANNSSYANTYEKGTEEYNKIMELYNNSYKESMLSAFFGGRMKVENSVCSTNSQSNVNSNVINANPDNYYIEFHYIKANSMLLNDEPYYKNDNEVVQYYKVLIEVSDNAIMSETTIYVENYSKYSTSQTISSSFQYITHAKQADLYGYLKDILK